MFTSDIKEFLVETFANESDFDSLCREVGFSSSFFVGNYGKIITDFLIKLETEHADPLTKLHRAISKLKPAFYDQVEKLFLLQKLILECPYRGLSYFREEDVRFFFGRDDYIKKLVQAVEKHSAIPLLGPSGSGKSSIVFAGLIPELRKKDNNILIAVFRPAGDPFASILAALLPILERNMSELERLAELDERIDNFKTGKIKLVNIIRRILELNRDKKVFLYADQFEELFTLTKDFTEQRAFLDQLTEAVEAFPGTGPAFNFLFSMRADFLNKALTHYRFGKLLEKDIKLRPMNREQLTESIEKPALVLNVKLEETLTETIINEIIDKPANLPLLEFALTQLWEKQSNKRLTLDAYTRIGGIEKALTKHAELVFESFTKEEKQKLPMFFTQMVSPGEGTEDTKRIAFEADIKSENWNLITKLADHKLVVTKSKDKTNTVEIIHESLIRNWRRLKEWIDQDRRFRIWQDEMRTRLQKWQNTGCKENALLSGFELQEAGEWHKTREENLSAKENQFIKKSINKRDKEIREKEEQQRQLLEMKEKELLAKKRAGRIQKSFIAAAVPVFILVLALLIIAVFQQRTSADLLANNYWRMAINAQKDNNQLLSLYLKSEAIKTASSKDLKMTIYRDASDYMPGYRLDSIFKHDDFVNGAVFNKDETQVLSYSSDGTVRIWNVKTGGQVIGEMKHDKKVNGAVFNQDESRVLSFSDDGTVRLWDVKTGTQVILEHDAPVTGAVFNQDESQVLSFSDDYTVRLWDVKTGTQVILEHDAPVYGAVFNRDESRVLSYSADGTVRIWDVKTGTQVIGAMEHEASVTGAVFNRDETQVLSYSFDGTVRLWDVKTGTQVIGEMKHEDSVTGAVFNKDESQVLSYSFDGTVRLWDVKTGTQVIGEMKHEDSVTGAVFNRDESRVLSYSSDGTVRIWDVKTGKQIISAMKHGRHVRGAVFNQDESRILSYCSDGTVRLWEIKTGTQVVREMKHDGWVFGAVFNQDESRVLSYSSDYAVRLWEVKTGRAVIGEMKHDGWVLGAVFNKDESRVLSYSSDYAVRLWDVNTGKEVVGAMKHDSSVNGAFFNQDESRVLSYSSDGTVCIWDVKTGTQVIGAMKHDEKVSGAVFNRDESRVLSYSTDGTVRIWDAKTGKQIIGEMQHDGWVLGAVFNQDESRVLSYSTDGTVRIWDVKTGTQVIGEMKHDDKVTGAVFNQDESRVLSYSTDGTVRIWDAKTGKQVIPAIKHEASVYGAVFNRDETQVLSYSSDGTVRIWDVKTGEQLGKGINYGFDVRGMHLSNDRRSIMIYGGKSIIIHPFSIDMDFPLQYFELQFQALTGLELDVQTMQLKTIELEEFRKIQAQYKEIGEKYYHKTSYKEQSVYRRYFLQESDPD